MSDEPNTAAATAEPLRAVVRIYEGQLHKHRDAAEQSLNALLDAEADRPRNTRRYECSPTTSTPAPAATAAPAH
jgi:hypothetical protein